MRFALLLYCATVPAKSHPAYDCVTLSVHPDKQAAVNAAHEWCLFDHLCVHHTYLQEIELGPKFHHVATGQTHDATAEEKKDAAPGKGRDQA